MMNLMQATLRAHKAPQPPVGARQPKPRPEELLIEEILRAAGLESVR